MDTIGGWEHFADRVRTDRAEIAELLSGIPSAAVEELEENGSMLAINGETAAGLAAKKNREEKLALAGDAGRYLLDFRPSEGMNSYSMHITGADAFPNCICIAAAAVLEKFSGRVRSKLQLSVEYASEKNSGDPFGALLSLISRFFPFVEFKVEKKLYGKDFRPGSRESQDRNRIRNLVTGLFEKNE